MRASVLALCVNAGMACAAAPATANKPGASGYPARPVRFIIPFPPSGGTDIVGRSIGQKVGDALGQVFVIDNRAGAAGTLGADIAAKAHPDGYTILLATASFAISAGYYKSLPYDPVRDFAGVSRIASGPLLLVTHPAVPARSVKELIALARASPNKLNYASGGAGGINHLAGELFASMTGAGIVHVPYKGAGPALAGLLGGEVQMMIVPLGASLPQVRAGKLRALAVASAQRSTMVPDLPTVAETGVRGYEADNWYGILAPRGTPQSIITLLNTHIVAALRADDTRERFATLGF
jgi:tripartite-type tricarboxylate transporter receptor subunit TctC